MILWLMGVYVWIKSDVGRGEVVQFPESCWLGDGGEDTCGITSLNGNDESLEEEWRNSCLSALAFESAPQFMCMC